MYLLYSLLLTLGVIALLPRLVYDAFRHGKYVAGLGERLGWLPLIETRGRPVIWLHCVSVGETQAARPLARAIQRKFPSHALVVSTVTLTGQRIAREVFREEAAAVIYFPFDWAWSVRRSLRSVKPSAVVIMETELWPRFLRECRERHIAVALVNGRLSAGSFKRYRLIRSFISRVVSDLALALMQSEADAERIRALGLAPERVMVSGNIKFDANAVSLADQALTPELSARFQLQDERSLIVAASTHAPEERIILEAFRQLRLTEGTARTRLLIAPRHPERFEEVASLLRSSGFRWVRRSSAPDAGDAVSEVILLDTIGELRAVYPLADLVFVGGSIARTGGHNVLEPAAVGACIVTGAHTANFEAVMRVFLEADALVQLPPLSEEETARALSGVFRELLLDDERRRKLASRALAVFEQNRGATERTVEVIAGLLGKPSDTSLQGRPADAQHEALSA
ncbi:MAG TPA: 3-deoxy-D-manno-octulosonic acid transferase [Pyrinomonadaceae bacterium]|jgi:3-deoxy-D-manno-octulosonic-acid transferase